MIADTRFGSTINYKNHKISNTSLTGIKYQYQFMVDTFFTPFFRLSKLI